MGTKTSLTTKKTRIGVRSISYTPDPLGQAPLLRAFLILRHVHESAQAILKAFDLVYRDSRSVGAPTDEDQDLLRAMLVMAAAGLDSLTKQLIRDAMPKLANFDLKVVEGLQTFVGRKLRDDGEESLAKRARDFLAGVLVAESMKGKIVEEYIADLTAGSLQSAGELVRAGNALGISSDEVRIDPGSLKQIFDIRNQIIHELDVDFSHPTRNRRTRSRDAMVAHANTLLKLADDILKAIDQKFLRHVST